MSTLQLDSTVLDDPVTTTERERAAAARAIATQPDHETLARMIGLTP